MNKKIILVNRLLRRIDKKLYRTESTNRQIIRWRFISFTAGFIILVISLFQPSFRFFLYGTALFCFGCFVFLVIWNTQLKKKILRWQLWRKIKRENLARLQLDWEQIPAKDHLVASQHPYALDLDIIGDRSLLRLLDTTVSARGAKFLVDWLLYPETNMEKLSRRQLLVQELKERSLFRNKLTLEALCISEKEINGNTIASHLQTPRLSWIPGILHLEILLLIACIFAFSGWYWFSFPPLLWGIPYFIYIVIFLFSLPYLAPIFHRTISLQLEFKKLEAVFLHLENRVSLQTPELARCCTLFKDKENKPSSFMKKISHVCDALSIQGNGLIHGGVNMIFPWDFFFVYRWKKLCQKILNVFPLWMDCLGKIEAASALANLANNNPEYTIPSLEINKNPSETGIHAQNIGHPLIPTKKRITNNFLLKGLGSLALITGSNMSGKSTFLKTLGINLCLAQAGGFICASSLKSSFFRIYGCIRINDSVTEGLSYFYMEVKRLKGILDATQDRNAPPVLALIDEIFKGTNNRERIIGSIYYIRALLQNNFLGLISTHDLEVTQVSREQKKIHNFHFQDAIENKRIKFDYSLRPGICPTTNALKILQFEGMPLPFDNEYTPADSS